MSREIICGIYKITSPTGRIYIGQSIDIYGRFKNYKNLKCKDQRKLYNSLLKYGVGSHTFEIIHQCVREQLSEMEKHYVNSFKTFNTKHGLNLKDGGSQCQHSDETKRRMSESHKGVKNFHFGKQLSEKHKRNLSEALSGERHPNFGKTFSKETRKKQSDALKGRKFSEEHTRKMSEAAQKRKVSPMSGKHHSREAREKMSKASKGKNKSPESVVKRMATRKVTMARIKQERLTMVFLKTKSM